jgi:hypothetical protein
MSQILLSDLDTEVLLALVWAGPFLTDQLRQVIMPAWSFRQLERRLTALEEHGLIEGGFFYRQPRRKPRPVRVGKVWSITARGREAITGHDRAPFRPTAPTRVLLNHDLVVSAVIAHIVVQTRPILSGIAVFREMRVDDQKAAPIADAIIVVRTRGQRVERSSLAWSRQGVQPGEAFRVIAVESDRATEELSVIAEKARVYRSLPDDLDYLERYHGVVPLALWVAPTRRRAESIHSTWKRIWPEGAWVWTTDAGLAADRFVEYADSQERDRTWLDEWAESSSAHHPHQEAS